MPQLPRTKQIITALGLVILSAFNFGNAQGSDALPDKINPVNHRVLIDPSSTRVSLGKVSLLVSPLTLKGKSYVADYELKVVPYVYKNEKGWLVLEGSDVMARKLLDGTAVKFIGKAVNKKDGVRKVIIGKGMPSTNRRGRVTFSIVTEHGLMVFDTSYHFEE